MPAEGIIKWVLRTYWRWTRPVTLGAQGCIFNDDGDVLLVRHTYRPGWHFPGGGVDRHESTLAALKRELDEEVGVAVLEAPSLYGLYAHGPTFPGDHIALFIVRSWQQAHVPTPNREIAEQRFFAVTALPDNINPPTARRIAEIIEGRQPAEIW